MAKKINSPYFIQTIFIYQQLVTSIETKYDLSSFPFLKTRQKKTAKKKTTLIWKAGLGQQLHGNRKVSSLQNDKQAANLSTASLCFFGIISVESN